MKHNISLTNVTYAKVVSFNNVNGKKAVLLDKVSMNEAYDAALKFEANSVKPSPLSFTLEYYKGHYSHAS
jgi:hypothetical protein